MVRTLFARRDLPPIPPDVAHDLPRYRVWLADREAKRLHRQGGQGGQDGEGDGTVGFLLVLDQHPAHLLEATLRTLVEQTSAAWTLSVALVGDASPGVEDLLTWFGRDRGSSRLAISRHRASTSRRDARAAAFDACHADLVGALDPGDVLVADAVRLLSAEPNADVVYGDHDQLDPDGAFCDPALKPDWSPELLLSMPYLGRPAVARRSLVEQVGGMTTVGGDWEHDLFLRLAERTSRVTHVAEVLCHRAGPVGGVDAAPPDPSPVQAALRRRGEVGQVVPGPRAGTWTVHRRPSRPATVSAVIPFRDAPRLLRACIDSLDATRAGTDLQLVLVDNGSEEPETMTLVERLAQREDVVVVRDDRPFNWAELNNDAVDATDGEVLLFVNNDVEARRPGWLEVLAAHALRPEVGVIGARLVHPDGRVQHAGVVLGMGGAAGHVLIGLPADASGYLDMAVVTRDCTAVTGACMAVRRDVFDSLGRFDTSLGVDLNDIDLCLRAGRLGLRVVYEPQVELIHHESLTRGTTASTENLVEFSDRWRSEILGGDPFLNRNLTRMDFSCGLAGPDEATWWRTWRSALEAA